MSGGHSVEPGELEAHGKKVSGIADDLSQSAAAGQSATPLGSDAFGLIGQAFAALIQSTVTSAVDNLQGASQTAQQLSSGISKAGDGYRRTDEGHAQVIDRIGQEI